jgi:lysophospholipase L1-like esterase
MKTLLASVLASLGLLASSRALAVTNVACVGDSITQNSNWSDRLGMKLGASYKATNYGLSGTTLLKNGDHPYWTSQQFKDSHSSNPDVVVIMLGTNDSKPFNWNAHKGEFVGDYEALVDSYAALPSHPKIYLNLCPPAGANGFQISGTVIENEVNPAIKQVAAAKGLPTIDVFTAFGGHNFDATLLADGVHPTGTGAQRIADTVYAALVAPPQDGGVATDAGPKDGGGGEASSPPDAGDGGARPAPDATGAAGVGAAGTNGAAGATGAAGTSGAAGMGGAAGTSGAAGVPGAGASGTGGGAAGAVTGAAGTGSPPPHATSGGGCAVSGGGTGLGGLVVILISLIASSLVRRRRIDG